MLLVHFRHQQPSAAATLATAGDRLADPTVLPGTGTGRDHLFPAFTRAGHRVQRDGDGRTSPVDRKIVNRQIQTRSARAGVGQHPRGHTP